MSNTNKVSGLELLLQNKEKYINAKKERRILRLDHERTGLSFVFYEPTKSDLKDYNEKLKARNINPNDSKTFEKITEKQEKELSDIMCDLLARCLKKVFPIGSDENEIEDIDLKAPKLKEAYNYDIPAEFFPILMEDREIGQTFQFLAGFSMTVKK